MRRVLCSLYAKRFEQIGAYFSEATQSQINLLLCNCRTFDYELYDKYNNRTTRAEHRADTFQLQRELARALTWPSLSLSAFERSPSQMVSIDSCVSAFFAWPAGQPRNEQIFCNWEREKDKEGE